MSRAARAGHIVIAIIYFPAFLSFLFTGHGTGCW